MDNQLRYNGHHSFHGYETDELVTIDEDTILLVGRIPDDFEKNKVFYKIMQIEDVTKVSEEA